MANKEHDESRQNPTAPSALIDDPLQLFFARQEEYAARMLEAEPGLSEDEIAGRAFDRAVTDAKASFAEGQHPEISFAGFSFALPADGQQPTPTKRRTRKRRKEKPAAKSPRLSIQQHLAVYFLVFGNSVTETASAVGASRQQVSQWVNWCEPFQEALEQRKAEIWSLFVDQLKGLMQKSLAVLEKALEGDDAVQTALAVLELNRRAQLKEPPGTEAQVEESEAAPV